MPPTIVYPSSGPTVAFDTPENHGAKRDGITDDTAAIQAAINATVAAGVGNGTNYGEVWFSSGQYLVAGTPGGHGTPTFANSQITLPFIAAGTNVQKFTLVLRGTLGGSALPYSSQTVGQKGGAVLYTTATGTNDGVYGVASVVGGPTAVQGYGGGSGNAWSNILVIVDGVSVVSSTSNPTMSGFNFEGILEAKIGTASYSCDATPTVMNGYVTTIATFTNQWPYGLAMPMTNNNDLSIIDDWSASGIYCGVQISEHTHIRDARSLYCYWGLTLDSRTGTPHWSQVDWMSIQNCYNGVGMLPSGGNYKVNISQLDVGSIAHAPFVDPTSLIYGDIHVSSNAGTAATKFDWTTLGLGTWINGWNQTTNNGRFMRMTSADVLPGSTLNQPTLPASGTAFFNYALRDAMVTITGGTVTIVAVDGSTTGMTSPCTVMVPTGKSITVTYTGSPVWNWILL